MTEKFTIYSGDCRDVMMNRMAPESVHCVVTSPPYWGLRDYGVEGQLGLEPVPDCLGWATGQRCGECFICKMVDVFRGVWRVLRKDGTCWVNMGDSYASSGVFAPPSDKTKLNSGKGCGENEKVMNGLGRAPTAPGFKPKDLCGIPWHLALALQADGWYLRQDIIWSKPNPMPESVTDRCTKSHEYLFLLSKSARYFYDAEAVKEVGADTEHTRNRYKYSASAGTKHSKNADTNIENDDFSKYFLTPDGKRNRRSVWTITTKGFPGAHFATFPPKLVEPCIKAGTSEKGCCPECGAGWVRVVEKGELIDDPQRVGRKVKAVQFNQNENSYKSGGTLGKIRKNTTTDWTPQCTCPAAGPIPCTVMDPFTGSGTTGVVALSLFRRFVGIELNGEYMTGFIMPRLEAEASRPKQMELF